MALSLKSLLSLTLPTLCTAVHSITLPDSPPTNAAVIDPSFPGFAFEQASFYNYSFDSDKLPNEFSQNLINSVLKRTGGIPLLRVGGTSGDRAHFNGSQHNVTNYPATENGVRFHPPFSSFGRPYFEAFKNFPGAKYEFQVPWDQWEKGQHLDNSLKWAEAGIDAIGLDNLYSLEIGNEANYYSWFTKSKYVDRYRKFKSHLKQRFPTLKGRKIFQVLDIASAEAESLPASDAFRLGFDKDVDSINQVAYHYYQGHGINTSGELQDWVSHGKTKEQMSIYQADIDFLQQNYPDIGLVLDEVGDNVGSGSAKSEIYNCFATALWRVDFQLHAMAMGIRRINFQQILNKRAAMWIPVKSEQGGVPQVTANYYAMPFAADFIGKSGETRVMQLELEDDDSDKLVAYAAFDSDKLARIALINMHLWRPEDGSRPKRELSIKNVPNDISKVNLHKLDSFDGALAKHDITWKGLQWTFESKGKDDRVKHDREQVQVHNQLLTVEIDATSAVIIEL